MEYVIAAIVVVVLIGLFSWVKKNNNRINEYNDEYKYTPDNH